MKFTLRLPGVLQNRDLLEVVRDLLRDMITYYTLLGLLLGASRLFSPPASIPDWLFLVSECFCYTIILFWIAAITTSHLKRLDAILQTRQEKVWVKFLMFFSIVMLILSFWVALLIAQK